MVLPDQGRVASEQPAGGKLCIFYFLHTLPYQPVAAMFSGKPPTHRVTDLIISPCLPFFHSAFFPLSSPSELGHPPSPQALQLASEAVHRVAPRTFAFLKQVDGTIQHQNTKEAMWSDSDLSGRGVISHRNPELIIAGSVQSCRLTFSVVTVVTAVWCQWIEASFKISIWL